MLSSCVSTTGTTTSGPRSLWCVHAENQLLVDGNPLSLAGFDMTVLRIIGSILGVIYASIPPYWILVHSFAPEWRKRRAKLKHVGPIWLAMWLVLGVAAWHWRLVTLYTSVWGWIPAVALIATAYGLYIQGTKNFTHDQLVG